jgi:hypothetical protein
MRRSSGRGVLTLVVEQVILLLLQLALAHEALTGGVIVRVV